jgi:hypothetical protein
MWAAVPSPFIIQWNLCKISATMISLSKHAKNGIMREKPERSLLRHK